MENETYEAFVKSRIKWLGSFQADFLHAAIGIMGELVEFQSAVNRKNALEELGDTEFYLVHMQLAVWDYLGEQQLLFDRTENRVTNGWSINSSLDDAITSAGNLLDCGKKMWVYNKPPSQLLGDIQSNFRELVSDLNTIHEQMGTSCGVLRANNEAKLRIRYPRGYTDQHAQARLDKAPGL